MHQCKICGMELPSRKALVYHLSSKQHKKQSVYCPWCNNKNVITRVVDLKAHCMSKHFVELDLQPKNFIGGNNSFYFSVYPEDYIDIFKPEPWGSQMAVEARRLMMNWAERVGMSLKERDRIREGWNAAKEKNQIISEEKENSVRKRVAQEREEDVSKIYENLFKATPLHLASGINTNPTEQPKKKVKFDIKLQKERKTNQTSDRQSNMDKENNKEHKHVGMSKKQDNGNKQEKNKSISENVTHKDENEKKGEIDTDLEDERDDLNLNTIITLETGKDGIRRLITTTQTIKEGERKNETDSIKAERVKINDDNLMKLSDENEDGMQNVQSIDKETEKMDDVGNSIIINEGHEERCMDVNSEIESKTDKVDCNEIESEKITERGDATDHNVEPEMLISENDEDSDESINMDEIDMARVWKNWELEIPTEKAEKESKKEGTIKLTLKEGQLSSKMGMEKKTETDRAVEHLVEKELREEYSIDENKKLMTKVTKLPKTYAERSAEILVKGAMPLCPPGRRDWNSVIVPVFINVGESSFSWPPMGWQNMTPDRKLLEWEAASWKLECLTQGFVPANVSRRYLLDKYMFLALPGSEGPKVEKSEKSCSASRAFTYKMLKDIARGERQPTKAEEDHISTVEYILSSEINNTIDLKSLSVPLLLAENDEN